MLTDTDREAEKPLILRGYYLNFDPTGVFEIDLILSAVARAGKAYHSTESWDEETPPYDPRFRGLCPSDWIQNAANDAAARHRTASTAALTAEIQRLRDRLDDKYALAEAIHNARFNGPVTTAWADEGAAGKAYCHRIANAVELHLLAALSTPSEVSEPVADESGGEGDVVFSEHTITLAHAVTTALLPGKGGDLDYWQMRKTVSLAIHNALATPPNPTNGDAVREALRCAEEILGYWPEDPDNGDMDIAAESVRKQCADALATLAKHVGAEG